MDYERFTNDETLNLGNISASVLIWNLLENSYVYEPRFVCFQKQSLNCLALIMSSKTLLYPLPADIL